MLEKHILSNNNEALYLELKSKNNSCLLCCTCNAHKSLSSYHLQEIAKELELYSNNFDNVFIMGDYNSEVSDAAMKSFCHFCKLRSFVVNPASSNNSENQSCIDLFLTNVNNLSIQKSLKLVYLIFSNLSSPNVTDRVKSLIKNSFMKHLHITYSSTI